MTETYTPPVIAPELGAGESSGGYREWCRERERQAPLKYSLRRHPELLFSVIVPVHNPAEHWLQECIDSVRGQFFADWELILADDASDRLTLNVLQKNQALDHRIKISLESQQSGISTTSNRAVDLAKGAFLVFLDHDDLLDAYALSAFAQRLNKIPDTDILYADEDRFDDHYQRIYPGFKPKFSLEKLLCTNYIHHPVVIRRTLFLQLGGFDSAYDGSQDYDLLLRAIEKTSRIEHLADVLYHMRLHSGSLSSGPAAKPEAHDRGIAAVRAYLQRQKSAAIIQPTNFPGCHNLTYPLNPRPKTSIAILADSQTTRDNIYQHWQQHENDELLICSDNSKSVPMRLNALAHKARGDILVFADGRLKPEPGCLDELLAHCTRKNIGLVTGKLTYRDDKLHSCGLTLGIRGCAGRWHYGCHAKDIGYGGWMGINHEVSAVPWQLMAVKKQLFMQAGLFNCQYHNHGFDVHLALQLSHNQAVKHLAVVLAQAVFPSPCPNQADLWQEQDFTVLWKHWMTKLNRSDPFFHPRFSVYDESISFITANELHWKQSGLFNAYDDLTIQLLWRCFN